MGRSPRGAPDPADAADRRPRRRGDHPRGDLRTGADHPPLRRSGRGVAFINDRPAALAAYWYGEDGDDFRRFLQDTTSGGVTRNDGLLHASLSNAPFGGVGGSGTGPYGGKAGFDEFTYRRTVAAQTGPQGFTDGMVGSALLAPELTAGIDQAITGVAVEIRTRPGL